MANRQAQVNYMLTRARQMGLDPNAVLAIAHHEGLGGGIGDSGTSFGPFQLHKGGALPNNIPLGGAQNWAWSNAGIDYALGKMAPYARGLRGQSAVSAISRGFERPANPGAEIADAMNWYGKGGVPGGQVGGPPAPNSPSGRAQVAASTANVLTSGSEARQQLIGSLLGNLQSFGSGNKQWGLNSLANTVNMIHAQRAAQQQAQQYGTDTTATTLSSGHVLNGVNPNSPTDLKAVQLAEKYVGTPYKWGGAAPGGFDCSGLLQFTMGQVGVKIPRTTYDQWKVGKQVGANQLKPGDAVFFKGSDSVNGLPGHVGMYIGGGKYIQAPHTGSNVQISTLAGAPDYMGARRYA